MKPTVYIETTIPSYLAAAPSRDLVVAAHQQITHDWWDRQRDRFDLFISTFVIEETSGGDAEAAGRRLAFLKGIRLLAATPEVERLAAYLLESGTIPAKSAYDAAHVAAAAVHRMDFLLTWNCKHLANAERFDQLRGACGRLGLACPIICTPEELMGE